MTECMKGYVMQKVGMELHFLPSLAQPFVLVSYREGECIMKPSSMRKNEMLDFYHPLDILLSLLLQQLMLLVQWRYSDSCKCPFNMFGAETVMHNLLYA